MHEVRAGSWLTKTDREKCDILRHRVWSAKTVPHCVPDLIDFIREWGHEQGAIGELEEIRDSCNDALAKLAVEFPRRRRIEALRAKAEGTPFPAEAES